jgi:putative Mg2+ transporter-C (MgtC) family protein
MAWMALVLISVSTLDMLPAFRRCQGHAEHLLSPRHAEHLLSPRHAEHLLSPRHAEHLLVLRGGSFEDELRLSWNLLQAAVLGSLIGIERILAGRPAGMRTMSLVAMGAALFTGVGRLSWPDGGARAAAQIASGVGFLGAGVIRARDVAEYRTLGKGDHRDYIKGLTTASAIWLSAGVGVACGSGHGLVGAAATFLTILIMASHRCWYTRGGKPIDLEVYCRG